MNPAIRALAVVVLLVLAGCATTAPDIDDDLAVDSVAVPAASVSDDEFAAWAQAQRQRVTFTKTAANQLFHDAERACWRRFAVNACITDARRERRRMLAIARTRELAVNAAERARRTRKRLDSIQSHQPGAQGAPAPGALPPGS